MGSGRVTGNVDTPPDYLKVWKEIWANKFAIVLIGIVCAMVAAGFSLVAPPIYRAEIVIIPAIDQAESRARPAAAGLGALMNAAGMLAGNNEGVRPDILALLRSRYLAEEFVRRNGLTQVLKPHTPQAWSLWPAVNRFRERVLSFQENPQTGIITVAIDWVDPVAAAQWANGFVALANELARARTLRDSRHNIEYLEVQIAQTNVLALRRAGYDSIKSETKTLMLAKARPEYAYTVVDPAVVPEMRNRPKRALMVVLGFCAGLFAAVCVVFGRCVLRSART